MLSVSVVIPHAKGRELLQECLASLAESTPKPSQTVLVLNGPDSADFDRGWLAPIPDVQILHFKCNIGFAAACNRGVAAADGELVFLLNDDAVVESDTIARLAEAFESHQDVGACQPKIISLQRRGYFDYSSAAGGEMDRWGIPFARGRVFDYIEPDRGQYDSTAQIFWGAGAALMVRRSCYLNAGGLDERFWAHMEEIDLQWRLQLMGWRIQSVGGARAGHRGAATISSASWRKHYLNHRNSLAMLVKNYSPASLLRYLPGRLLLELAVAFKSLASLDFKRFAAVAAAQMWLLFSLPYLRRARKVVQDLRLVSDAVILNRLYPRSVAWQYFVHKRRTWAELQETVGFNAPPR